MVEKRKQAVAERNLEKNAIPNYNIVQVTGLYSEKQKMDGAG